MKFSYISASDSALADAGNRFDVAGGGVLYCATELAGCYAETLSRFRPSARMREIMADEDPSLMMCGGVPADWRHRRLKVVATLDSPLPFLDVEHVTSHEFLNSAMARDLAGLKIDSLDVGLVRGRNRLLTRAVAAWAYAATDEAGYPLYSGLRYMSRIGEHECWAIFEGSAVRETARDTITATDPVLESVAADFALRIF